MWQKIKNKEDWNQLVGSQERASFLQSWQWGEFQQSLGREVRRLSWGDEIVVQAIKMPLPFGKSYWYIPRGPVVISKGGDWGVAVSTLKKIFADDGFFLRVDPDLSLRAKVAVGDHSEAIPSPTRLTSGLLRSSSRSTSGGLPRNDNRERTVSRIFIVPSAQAQCVRILDLRLSSDELLAAMHPKTRYNINLAQKKGVIVAPGTIENFLRLNKQTRARDKFRPHPDYYYQKMAEALGGDFLKIWQTAYHDKILASAIIAYFGDTVTYVHGASADEQREVMAPHLLHWQIIKDAQARGFHYYDLGGVNPPDTNHLANKKAWEGISRFKQGFGGEIICYPESFDLIYRLNWYRLYWLAKKFL